MFEFVKEREVALSVHIDHADQDPKPVSKALVSVYEKGLTKVKDNFYRKLHECFPSMRMVTFNRIVETREEDEEMV